jgi:hypothetical protein
MKRLLLFILLSIGLTNVSFAYEYSNAELCSLISNNNCDGLCVSADSELVTEARKRKLSCGGVTETLQYDVSSNDETCKNGFYKAYEPESSYPHDYFCEKLPLNTIALGTFSGYTCKPGYYNKFEFGVVCEKVPTNAVKKGNGWACKDGYKKTSSGNSCTRSTDRPFEIWTNDALCNFVAKKKVNSGYLAELKIRNARCKVNYTGEFNFDEWNWECNDGYYIRKEGSWSGPGHRNSCVKGKVTEIPENARTSGSALGWQCNAGFKKSGDKCINKINKLVVPSYRN